MMESSDVHFRKIIQTLWHYGFFLDLFHLYNSFPRVVTNNSVMIFLNDLVKGIKRV